MKLSNLKNGAAGKERGVYAASTILTQRCVEFISAVMDLCTVKRRKRRAPMSRHLHGYGLALLAISALFIAGGLNAAERDAAVAIPARPEALKYPALKYEPPAPEKYRVNLKSGPVAYVVPDRELPLVNLVVYARTGEYLDPAGKEGLANLTGYLLARGGTKTKTAEEMEERLAFLAAQLNSAVNDTQGSVSLNLLSKDLAEGLDIIREVMTEPRFQDDKIALRKQQSLQAMKQRNDDSSSIESREYSFLAFGENFWVNRYSTAASIEAITRADLEQFHHAWFAPSNFVIAASGDFDRDQMIQKLETLFSNWPFQGEPAQPIPTNTVFASPGIYLVDKDVNQGRVDMILPGITRDNPDYFSIIVMNDILGGGGFTSRIMSRVRSDEGLAYDAHSSFPGGVYYPSAFTAGFQSKSRTVPYAASIVEEEMKRVAKEPVSDTELNTSKRGFIERFPNSFSTKAQVANTFAQDEFTGRYAKDPQFWQKYRGRIEKADAASIQNVASKYLQLEKLVILIVGKKDEILLGQPGHDVKLTQLTSGPLKELPLRDPLTMKPLPLGAGEKSAGQ